MLQKCFISLVCLGFFVSTSAVAEESPSSNSGWGVTQYRVGVGVSQLSGTFSSNRGDVKLSGQGRQWPFALVYHESGAIAQIGVQQQELTGNQGALEVSYVAQGLKAGVGWSVPLAGQWEVNPLLTLFSGKAIAQVEEGTLHRPGDVTSWGLELPVQWDLGAWWGGRNLFVGFRLGAYSGATEDDDPVIKVTKNSSYGLELGGTFTP